MDLPEKEWKATYHGWVEDGGRPIWFVETDDKVICELHDRVQAYLVSATYEMHEACKKMADLLYGWSESDKKVPVQDYPRFKETYTLGFQALAKADGHIQKVGRR